MAQKQTASKGYSKSSGSTIDRLYGAGRRVTDRARRAIGATVSGGATELMRGIIKGRQKQDNK